MLNTISEHIDAFVPSWQEYKIPVAVQMGFLCSQPHLDWKYCGFILDQTVLHYTDICNQKY